MGVHENAFERQELGFNKIHNKSLIKFVDVI